jgi:hypothetical protein
LAAANLPGDALYQVGSFRAKRVAKQNRDLLLLFAIGYSKSIRSALLWPNRT